jgi:hypothetical protein
MEDSGATTVRFGHAMTRMEGKIGLDTRGPIMPSVRKPCSMYHSSSKDGSSLSDSLRKALGLPPIEPQPMQLTRVKIKLDEEVPMVSATYPVSPC